MANFSALKTAIQNAIKQNGNEEITGDVLQQILLSIVSTMGDGAINTIEQNLSSETLARQGADNTLQQNINSEAGARQSADNTLQSHIDEEALARGNADTQLQNAINAIKADIDNGYVYAGIATPSSTPVSGKVFYIATDAGTYTNFGGQVLTQGINILRFNGSAWSSQQLIGIDDVPTQGSNNLVKSGGVLKSIIQNGPAFDLSSYNAVGGVLATYADLSAALTALNALDAAYKQPGMSLKFVLTSDNKYVQYRLMLSTFTAAQFANPYNWQGIGENVGAVDINLVTSSAIYNNTQEKIIENVDLLSQEINEKTVKITLLKKGYYNTETGEFVSSGSYISTDRIKIQCGALQIKPDHQQWYNLETTIYFYNSNQEYISCLTHTELNTNGGYGEIPHDAVFFAASIINTSGIKTFEFIFAVGESLIKSNLAPRRKCKTVVGYYNISNGKFESKSYLNYRTHTFMINTLPGDVIKIIDYDNTIANQFFLFYNEDKTYIGSIGKSNILSDGSVIAPSNARYFTYTIDKEVESFEVEIISKNYSSHCEKLIEGSISGIVSDVNNIKEAINLNEENTIVGYYDRTTGELNTRGYQNYRTHSNKILVSKGDRLAIINYDSTSYQYFCIYDNNEILLGIIDNNVIIDNNGSVRVNIDNAASCTFSINKAVDEIVIDVINNIIIDYVDIPNKWAGKTIAWYGTSIPAGYPKTNNQNVYAYPNLIAKKLGANILNYCVPLGVIRTNKADGTPMSSSYDNKKFTDLNSPINYKTNMIDLVGTANEPDLFVFDYGVNDIEADASELNTTIDYTSRTLDTFIGSYGFVIQKLLEAKPKSRIIILTHYSDDGIQNGTFGFKNVWKKMNDAIVGLCEYWGIKCLDARRFTGWVNTKLSASDISSVENISQYCDDNIHPASGSENKAKESVTLLADLYYPIIRDFA